MKDNDESNIAYSREELKMGLETIVDYKEPFLDVIDSILDTLNWFSILSGNPKFEFTLNITYVQKAIDSIIVAHRYEIELGKYDRYPRLSDVVINYESDVMKWFRRKGNES